MSFIPMNLLVVSKLINHRQVRSHYNSDVCSEIWFILCLLKPVGFCKKGTRYLMQRGWIVLWVCLALPVDCQGSSGSSCQQVLWKQLCLLLPFPRREWLSSTQSVGAISLGGDTRFLPLQRQGLSPTSRELMGGIEPYRQGIDGACVHLQYSWTWYLFVLQLA